MYVCLEKACRRGVLGRAKVGIAAWGASFSSPPPLQAPKSVAFGSPTGGTKHTRRNTGNSYFCIVKTTSENAQTQDYIDGRSKGFQNGVFQKQIRLMTQMHFTTLDDALDEHFGKRGTSERDKFEADVEAAVNAYRIGEARRNERLKQNLTQEQLGERMGVKRAQISRLERGLSVSIPTLGRAFKALGITSGTLDLGLAGKVVLW